MEESNTTEKQDTNEPQKDDITAPENILRKDAKEIQSPLNVEKGPVSEKNSEEFQLVQGKHKKKLKYSGSCESQKPPQMLSSFEITAGCYAILDEPSEDAMEFKQSEGSLWKRRSTEELQLFCEEEEEEATASVSIKRWGSQGDNIGAVKKKR
ncbi:Hypothetical predicted protein [Pelobates cultripes]|uniref:Uncharacterized protein n=1 Tax=Pelobates cultripes TaxID=61616 RepID=A0AAD1RIJ3_PELCU|nr:Hypothetical predicted protein [Pelobates cultripes]